MGASKTVMNLQTCKNSKCGICRKWIKRKKIVGKHNEIAHVATSSDKVDNIIICSATKKKLEYHKRKTQKCKVSEGIHLKCKDCRNSFKRKYILGHHIKAAHGGLGKHRKCEICGNDCRTCRLEEIRK